MRHPFHKHFFQYLQEFSRLLEILCFFAKDGKKNRVSWNDTFLRKNLVVSREQLVEQRKGHGDCALTE